MRQRKRKTHNPEKYAQLLENLARVRNTHNKTQAQVAACIGVSRPQYTLIESGYSTLSVDQLFSLAKLYGVTPDTLLS